MRRYVVWIAAACMVVVSGSAMVVHSQEQQKAPRAVDAERAKLIEEFKRTGLATTPEDAMLLRVLVQARGAKRGIEVGTERGFGAINMGIGFERNGGHLFTIEITPRIADEARANLEKAGLSKTVTVITGDALKTLPTLEGEFDFLFLDALKSDYLKYLKLVEKKLKPGTLIVADNAIRSANAMKDFLDYVKESPDYEMVIVQASQAKRDGMAICCKIR